MRLAHLRRSFMSSPILQDLPTQIAALGQTVRQLKLDKQPCSAEVEQLKALKALLPKSDAPLSVPVAVSQKGKSKVGQEAHGRLSLKVPKVCFPFSFFLFCFFRFFFFFLTDKNAFSEHRELEISTLRTPPSDERSFPPSRPSSKSTEPPQLIPPCLSFERFSLESTFYLALFLFCSLLSLPTYTSSFYEGMERIPS